jgi:beta-barrel assembly-enhancing protease
MFLHRHRFLCWLCVLATSAVAAAQVNVDPKKGRVTDNPTSGNRYTIEQEVQLGRQAVPEIEKKLKLLPAAHPLSKYINQLGQQLADKAPGYKFPYTFKVVNEKSINAFAMPGGPIYVHTGLIEKASEAELAGVMGHEISHVVMRHSTRQASRQMKAQIPLAILGGVLGAGVGGWAGQLGQMGISFAAGSVFMKYSRDAETEADMVGAQIIYDAGYDPQAIVTFFQKLKAEQGQKSGPKFLASHPDPGNRAKNVASILSRFPKKKFQDKNSPEYSAAKKALAGEIEPAATIAELPAMPRLDVRQIASGTTKSFQHAAYSVNYPAGWQLTGNADSSVEIAPEDGSSNGTLAYGVMISGFQPKSKTKELDAAVRELRTDIELANPALRLANSPQAAELDGGPARRLDYFGDSAVRENGKALKERVRLIASVNRSGVVIYLVLVAPEPDFQQMWSAVFEPMLKSLKLR